MEIKTIKTGIFSPNEDLLSFIFKYIKNLPDKSVLVVTSKIVALAEGRIEEKKGERQKTNLIRKESDFAVKTKVVWMTIKDGMVLASAGIDESNADGKLILLPKNSFKTAELLRKKIMAKFRLKNLGIIITDSRLMPLRTGSLGIALGFSGFKAVRNYVGKKDIFGRVLKISKANVVDSLATSAVVCMGEGNERMPIAVISGAPVAFSNKVKPADIIVNAKDDIYAPLFKSLHLKSKKK